MGIAYISYNEFVSDIARYMWKVPRNIDLVLAIPRSGLIPATMIAQYLNVNVMTVQRFCEIVENNLDITKEFSHGFRPCNDCAQIKNILVVDDTIYSGKSMLRWSDRFKDTRYNIYNIVFCAIYEEGPTNLFKCDFVFRAIKDWVYSSDLKICLYEWNLFNHGQYMNQFAFDIDGVLCLDPPDERCTDKYEEYIKNPVVFHVPDVKQSKTTFITYRLNKYRDITNDFLVKIGCVGCKLYMTNFSSYEDRAKIKPYEYKASLYKSCTNLKLFIESNDTEAKAIVKLSGKPVYCVETNTMYNPN